MRELSLHILDIAENSIKAGATKVDICVTLRKGVIEIKICDNGRGMSPDLLKAATSPFVTTKTTCKVGMGLPLLKQASKEAGGEFHIESKVDFGTKITATFMEDSVDRVPLGDIPATLAVLLSKSFDYYFFYEVNGRSFAFDTEEVKEKLRDIDIDSPEIQTFIKSMLKENIESINGGIII